MSAIRVCLIAGLVVSPLFASTVNRVALLPEQRTTLHIGQIATLQMPAKREYVIEQTGKTLVESKRQGRNRTVVYRAAHAGNETIILTPVGLAESQCVSCDTRHYFVTVVR